MHRPHCSTAGDIVRPCSIGRVLGAEDADIKPVDFFLFDVTGGVFEYQITEALGPNTTHSKVCGIAVTMGEGLYR
jgi:hypothetical protein